MTQTVADYSPYHWDQRREAWREQQEQNAQEQRRREAERERQREAAWLQTPEGRRVTALRELEATLARLEGQELSEELRMVVAALRALQQVARIG